MNSGVKVFITALQSQIKLKKTKPYCQNDKAKLRRVYEATKSGMSVYRAAKMYSVPKSTLPGRTRCNVGLDAKSGPDKIFTVEEEKQLVEHVTYTAYGYMKSNIQYMAADFGRSVGGGKVRKRSE